MSESTLRDLTKLNLRFEYEATIAHQDYPTLHYSFNGDLVSLEYIMATNDEWEYLKPVIRRRDEGWSEWWAKADFHLSIFVDGTLWRSFKFEGFDTDSGNLHLEAYGGSINFNAAFLCNNWNGEVDPEDEPPELFLSFSLPQWNEEEQDFCDDGHEKWARWERKPWNVHSTNHRFSSLLMEMYKDFQQVDF